MFSLIYTTITVLVAAASLMLPLTLPLPFDKVGFLLHTTAAPFLTSLKHFRLEKSYLLTHNDVLATFLHKCSELFDANMTLFVVFMAIFSIFLAYKYVHGAVDHLVYLTDCA
jgi:preprotein translocase subunit SecY